MGCHGVPGTVEARLRLQRRDDELCEIRRKAAAKAAAAKFQPRVRAKRRGLTAKERAALMRDHGPEAKAWLEGLDDAS